MKLHEGGRLNRLGKVLAKPLSRILCTSMTGNYVSLAEAYLGILLGKGAGTGWALDAEVQGARSMIKGQRPVLFDVGANVGEWTLRLRELFQESEIYLFEPQPACLDSLYALNLQRARIIPHAVSSSGGQRLQLFTPGDGAGTASLYERGDSYFQAETYSPIDVTTVTIDEVVAKHQVKRIDFMKLDVEGHELSALQGARKTLESQIVQALSFEFGSGNINSRTFFRDFWNLLSPLGFQMYRIQPCGRLQPIREYYEDCEYFRGVSNYVACLKPLQL